MTGHSTLAQHSWAPPGAAHPKTQQSLYVEGPFFQCKEALHFSRAHPGLMEGSSDLAEVQHPSLFRVSSRNLEEIPGGVQHPRHEQYQAASGSGHGAHWKRPAVACFTRVPRRLHPTSGPGALGSAWEWGGSSSTPVPGFPPWVSHITLSFKKPACYTMSQR